MTKPPNADFVMLLVLCYDNCFLVNRYLISFHYSESANIHNFGDKKMLQSIGFVAVNFFYLVRSLICFWSGEASVCLIDRLT